MAKLDIPPRAAGVLGLLAVLVAAGAGLARAAALASVPGLALVAGGTLAGLLLAFTPGEIVGAFRAAVVPPPDRRAAALVWTAAARNAWLLSATGALAGFVSVLASDPGSLARVLAGLGERAAGVALGALTAVVSALVALSLSSVAGPKPRVAAASPSVGQRGVGFVVLLALFAWPLASPGSEQFQPLAWLLHPPAVLVTLGGALALALYLRETGRGAAVVAGLAGSGTIAALLGIVLALHGFATVRVEDVAGGIMLAVSSGYVALFGLLAIGLPLLDRDLREGGEPPAVARWVAVAFSLLVIAVVVLAVILVMVPMERPAG
jgi:hypothetical protein